MPPPRSTTDCTSFDHIWQWPLIGPASRRVRPIDAENTFIMRHILKRAPPVPLGRESGEDAYGRRQNAAPDESKTTVIIIMLYAASLDANHVCRDLILGRLISLCRRDNRPRVLIT